MRKKLETDFFLLQHTALHENDRHEDTELWGIKTFPRPNKNVTSQSKLTESNNENKIKLYANKQLPNNVVTKVAWKQWVPSDDPV